MKYFVLPKKKEEEESSGEVVWRSSSIEFQGPGSRIKTIRLSLISASDMELQGGFMRSYSTYDKEAICSCHDLHSG